MLGVNISLDHMGMYLKYIGQPSGLLAHEDLHKLVGLPCSMFSTKNSFTKLLLLSHLRDRVHSLEISLNTPFTPN